MTIAHTGGPWQARSEYEPWLIIGNVDGEILQDGPSYTYTEICEVVEGDEAGANARLIAAAPELLANARLNVEAWANVLEFDLLPPQHRDTVERLLADNLAAIAKATGK